MRFAVGYLDEDINTTVIRVCYQQLVTRFI